MFPEQQLSPTELYWYYQGFTPLQLEPEHEYDYNEADLNPEEDFSDGS